MMATPIAWDGANKILKAPKEWTKEQCQDLPTFNNGVCSVSCWQFSKDELVDVIQNDGKFFVSIMFGASQPPVFAGSEATVREVVVDYGKVWK